MWALGSAVADILIAVAMTLLVRSLCRSIMFVEPLLFVAVTNARQRWQILY